MLRLLLISTFLSAPAHADPWLRQSGAGFLSFGLEATEDDATNQTTDLGTFLYERGLTDRLTFGLDLSAQDAEDWTALSYIKRPVGDVTGPARASVSLGVGVRSDPASLPAGDTEPVFLIGGAIGRSYDSSFGDGWISLDTQYRYRLDSDEEVLKTDLTLGLNATDQLALIGQLQLGQFPGADPSARVSASMVGQITPTLRAEVGILYGVENDNTRGLKVGTWLDF
jgi:hypothetical protein